jgi:hypothetical protein
VRVVVEVMVLRRRMRSVMLIKGSTVPMMTPMMTDTYGRHLCDAAMWAAPGGMMYLSSGVR